MGSLLHGSAKTTPVISKIIQESIETNVFLAKKYGLNRHTIAKWKAANSIEDKCSGSKNPKSSLSDIEQRIVCEFRRVTKLSID